MYLCCCLTKLALTWTIFCNIFFNVHLLMIALMECVFFGMCIFTRRYLDLFLCVLFVTLCKMCRRMWNVFESLMKVWLPKCALDKTCPAC